MNNSKNNYFIAGAIFLIGIVLAFIIIYKNNWSQKEEKSDGNSSRQEIVELVEDGKNAILGNPKAQIAIVEFSDFQCPFCGRFFKQTLPKIKDKYILGGKVKFIYKDFAFLGTESQVASQAARCAGDQEKYWDYHNYLFDNQQGENKGTFSKENLQKFASSLGLRLDLFNNCLNTEKYKEDVKNESLLGKSLGVSATPAIFLGRFPMKFDAKLIREKIDKKEYVIDLGEGNMLIVGAQPLEVYIKAIEELIIFE